MPTTSGRFEAGGLAVIGAAHVRKQQPLQDAYQLAWSDDGSVLAMAVADGHGTCRHGDVGAKVAVEVAISQLLDFHLKLTDKARGLSSVLELARNSLGRWIVEAWCDRVKDEIGRISPDASAQAPNVQAFGTTLIAVLAAHDFLLMLQIGDGDVLVVDETGNVTRPLGDDPAAFADETTSMCSSTAWVHARVHGQPLPDSEALVMLATDGYSKSYADNADFGQIGPDYLGLVRSHGFNQVIGFLPAFLDRVTTDGCGDDVTLGLVHVMPGSGSRAVDLSGDDIQKEHAVQDQGQSEAAAAEPGVETP